jgi:putative effector of murein hydrolase LrgA (UPF0299 family)
MNITNLFLPDNVNIAGIQLLDLENFLELLLRFILNTCVILILVRWLYYSTTRRKDYLFTYILIATIVFLLCFLLESVKLQIGFALGLFAIFGIIRYRTNAMPIKEMTYLFLIIGVSVINALTSSDTSLIDLLFSNIVIVFITCGLEKLWLLKHESSKTITYEKINLIKPEKNTELLADLRDRTGIKDIHRIETGKIDFLRDTCEITIFYYITDPENKPEETDGTDSKDDDDE